MLLVDTHVLLDVLQDDPQSDFFIGAHAAANGWPLLTRDCGRFRTSFPALVVVAP